MTTETEYRYTGQLRQAEVGLYYYVARWYAPQLDRFAQADSIIPLESQGVQACPLRFTAGVLRKDRYAGMNNNPVRYNDPSGHNVGCGGEDASSCDSAGNYERCRVDAGGFC